LKLGFSVLSSCFSLCELLYYFLQGGNNEKRMSGDLGTFKDKTLTINKLKEIFSVVLLCLYSCIPPAFLPVNYFINFLRKENNEKGRREGGLIRTTILRQIESYDKF